MISFRKRGLPFETSVTVQDFPDKGRGSWEKESGADLYISLVIHDDDRGTVNKGMLVQSKWDDTFKPTHADFRGQCQKMLELSKSSYVWKFGPHGVESVQALNVLHPPHGAFSSNLHTPWASRSPTESDASKATRVSGAT